MHGRVHSLWRSGGTIDECCVLLCLLMGEGGRSLVVFVDGGGRSVESLVSRYVIYLGHLQYL